MPPSPSADPLPPTAPRAAALSPAVEVRCRAPVLELRKVTRLSLPSSFLRGAGTLPASQGLAEGSGFSFMQAPLSPEEGRAAELLSESLLEGKAVGDFRSGFRDSQTAEPLVCAIRSPRFQHAVMSGYLTRPSDLVLVLCKLLVGMGGIQLQRGINGWKRLSSEFLTVRNQVSGLHFIQEHYGPLGGTKCRSFSLTYLYK